MKTKRARGGGKCRFLDDAAEESGDELPGGSDDDDGVEVPTAEDLAFLDDNSDVADASDEDDCVRISKRERRVTKDDRHLVLENAGLAAVEREEKAPRRRAVVYKDDDEDGADSQVGPGADTPFQCLPFHHISMVTVRHTDSTAY